MCRVSRVFDGEVIPATTVQLSLLDLTVSIINLSVSIVINLTVSIIDLTKTNTISGRQRVTVQVT